MQNWKIQLEKYNTKKTWWFRISKKRWLNDWHELKPIQKTIMLTLWLYAGNRTHCYPSMETLAGDLRVSLKNGIWKNIKVLEEKGFIRTEKLTNQRGRYNKYHLLK